MSLDHAILGFLKDRPRSGYDLKTVFDMTVRHFWRADQSQIYRTLARLADHGWIETEIIQKDRRLDQKIYHLTQKGNEELLKWLKTPTSIKTVRLPKMIQIFFASHLPDDEAVICFERFVDFYRRALAEMHELPQKGQTYKDSNPSLRAKDYYFRMLTLEYGIRLAQTSLEWGEEVLARLKRGDHLKGNPNEGTRDQREPPRGARKYTDSGRRIPSRSAKGRG
jgi:PadR family transcriptional regulator, regulatory protein AphA